MPDAVPGSEVLPHVAAAGVDMVEMPLHRFIGVELISPERPELGVRFTVSERTAGPNGLVHGGVVSLLLDAAAYLALIPHLAPEQRPVSHDIHISLMRSASVGQVVELRGMVVQQGRTLAFMESEAIVEGRTVATARITKSILQPR